MNPSRTKPAGQGRPCPAWFMTGCLAMGMGLAAGFPSAGGESPAPANPQGASLTPPIGQPGSKLRSRWTSDLGGGVAKDIFLPFPEVEERPAGAPASWMPPELLFLVTEDNRLGCMDRLTGHLRWMTQLPGPIVGDRPAITPNGVYLIARQRLIGLELLSGDLLFDITLPFAAAGGMVAVPGGRFGRDIASGRRSTSPVVALRAIREDRRTAPDGDESAPVGEILYIAGADNLLRQVEVTARRWPSPHMPEYRSLGPDLRMTRHHALVRWNVPVDYPGLPAGSVMIGQPGCVFVLMSSYRDNKAHLLGFDANRMEGAVPGGMMPFRFQRPVAASPLVADGLLLAPCLDGSLHALSGSTNFAVWKYAAGESLHCAPQYAVDPLERAFSVSSFPEAPDLKNDDDIGEEPFAWAPRQPEATVAEARSSSIKWRPSQARRRSLVLQKIGKTGPLMALCYLDGVPAWAEPFKGGRLAVAQMETPNEVPALRIFFVVQNDDDTLSGVRMSDGYEIWRSPFPEGRLFAANARVPMAYVLVDGGKGVMALERLP